MASLGGRRRKPARAAPSHNTYWRIEAFRNYADYAETAEFRDALAHLIAVAETATVAVMCAEAVWWRCHRRIITDYLVVRGIEVVHILGPGQTAAGSLTPGAQVMPDGTIHYVKEPQLFESAE